MRESKIKEKEIKEDHSLVKDFYSITCPHEGLNVPFWQIVL